MKSQYLYLGTFLWLLVACGATGQGESENGLSERSSAKLNLYLTDAPNENLKEVVVDVAHVEVWLQGRGREGRLVVAQGLGPIDLLQLQNGLLLPLASIPIPEGVAIRQFRILLNKEGHYATRTDNSQCRLKTPSAQQSGIKLILTQTIELHRGQNYSLVIDFDAKKSVVQQGHGGCLLKPVIKLKAAIQHDPDDGLNYKLDEIPPGHDLLGGHEPSNENDRDYHDHDGFDLSDPSTWPPGITAEDLVNYF